MISSVLHARTRSFSFSEKPRSEQKVCPFLCDMNVKPKDTSDLKPLSFPVYIPYKQLGKLHYIIKNSFSNDNEFRFLKRYPKTPINWKLNEFRQRNWSSFILDMLRGTPGIIRPPRLTLVRLQKSPLPKFQFRYTYDYHSNESIVNYYTEEKNSLEEKLLLLLGLTTSVSNLHKKNIVHLDLKNDNFVVDSFRNLLLIDFDGAFYKKFPRLLFTEMFTTRESKGLLKTLFNSRSSIDFNTQTYLNLLKKIDMVALGIIFCEYFRETPEITSLRQDVFVSSVQKMNIPYEIKELIASMILLPCTPIENKEEEWITCSPGVEIKLTSMNSDSTICSDDDNDREDDFLQPNETPNLLPLHVKEPFVSIEEVLEKLKIILKPYKEDLLKFLKDNNYDREKYFLYKDIEEL